MIIQKRSRQDESVATDITADLTRVLFEGRFDQVHAPWRDLFSNPIFHHRELPPEERMALSYERLRHVNKSVNDGDGPEILPRDATRLTALHEWVGPVDPGLGTILSIHYNLVLGSLLDAKGAHDLRPFLDMDRIGVYLCTELAHGNSAALMETTATYDPVSREFILHTPRPEAAKFMPNTSPVGGPKTALVAARLITGSQDQGVHLFLVPLHDETGQCLPGITIERLPQTTSAPVDHSMTTFAGVRLPHEAMLQADHGRLTPDGVYTSTVGSARKRFLASVSRVTVGKLCMQAYHLGATRHALTVAVRYAHSRHTSSGTRRGTVPLWQHRSHHAPLIDALATSYAATFLHRTAVRKWEQAVTEADRDDAERLAAITKGWITWRGRQVMTECRERCGAQGLFLANGIAGQLAAGEGAITAEGDNKVIWVKAGMEMLLGNYTPKPLRPGPSDLNSPEALQDLLADTERIWHERARVRSRSPRPGGVLDRTVLPVLQLVDAHAHYLAAEGLLTAARQTTRRQTGRLLYALHRLFALRHIADHSGDLLAAGRLESGQVLALPDTIEDVIDELAPHGLVLANGQAVSERLLLSHPIMAAGTEQ
ncbi:acyl-CoA dehydrogenase [Streptomyces monashensis]|uniref:acyl-CoA dehydrogenase family protein n=1 Tax=Streptomyces monashensis TaxID=1678012 RepID=UPI001FE266CA|nr:acyl-CoA dehydrogenase [Streptomyces monashensis]